MRIIFQKFTPILTSFYISARMCVSNHGNLRIRDFGVISTIPSWALNQPGTAEGNADVRACDFGTLRPLGQMHPQQVDNPALAHLSVDNNLCSLR